MAQRPNPQSPASTHAISDLGRFRIGILVHKPALCRQPIFAPLLFQMDQTPLPLTKRKMLQSR
jgi:hypothetical protein